MWEGICGIIFGAVLIIGSISYILCSEYRILLPENSCEDLEDKYYSPWRVTLLVPAFLSGLCLLFYGLTRAGPSILAVFNS